MLARAMRRQFAALCVAFAPLTAAAQPAAGEEEGIRYLSGGGDEAARAEMRRAADEFTLRLQFDAGEERQYVSDVQVIVSDLSGDPLLDLPRTGPLLFIALPTGRYLVQARLGDTVLERAIAVGGAPGRVARFHWTGADSDG